MVTGELAGQAVLASAGDIPGLARRYASACDYEIGQELRDSVAIQRFLFADRRRIARAIDGANREKVATKLILEFVAGRRSYRDLRRRLLGRFPFLAGRLAWEWLTRLVIKNSVVERRTAF